MRITLTTLSGDFLHNLDVSGDMELENFKALCELECGIPAAEMSLLCNGRPLHDDKKSLKDYGIVEDDVLLAQRIQGARGRNPAASAAQQPAAQSHAPQQRGGSAGRSGGLPLIDFSQIHVPSTSNQASSSQNTLLQGSTSEDPYVLREMLLSNQSDLAILKERNPPLASALLSGNPEKFVQEYRRQQRLKAEKDRERQRLIAADPFDADAQQRIAEEIRQRNVDNNMEAALEYAPESFGQVVMLYIDCHVNGHPVKAFVDSGAQMTIMSQACAERCGIMRLVDVRWAGIAKGVGEQKIIGRVHLCQIKIENNYLQTSFSILENQPMDMLLGLDMLKRHQCIIDLHKNQLKIGTTGTVTSFLAEGDLPAHARLNRSISSTSTSTTQEEDRMLAEALSRSAAESAAATHSANQPSSSGTQPGAANFPETDIRKIVSNGFTREEAIEELRNSNGNVDLALAALFAKAISC